MIILVLFSVYKSRSVAFSHKTAVSVRLLNCIMSTHLNSVKSVSRYYLMINMDLLSWVDHQSCDFKLRQQKLKTGLIIDQPNFVYINFRKVN